MPPGIALTAPPVAATTTPAVATFGSSTTAGQLVVVGISNDSGSTLSTGVTDNKGNTYTKAVSGTGQELEVWYSLIATGGSSHAVSVAWSLATGSYCSVTAQAFGGFTGPSPFDTAVTASGTSTAASASAAPSTGSSLVVSVASGAAAPGAALALGPSSNYGLTTAGSLTDVSDNNFMNGTKITTVNTGYLSSISVYVGAVGTSPNNQFQCALYADSAGSPGALIASSASGTLVANSLNTVAIQAPLAAATSYWLIYNTNGTTSAQNNLKYNSGGTSASSSASVPFGTWPSTFGAYNAAGATFSIYATYTDYGNLTTIANPGCSLGMASKVTTATSAQAATMTMPTSQFWRAAAVVFKEISSAGGPNVAVLSGGFLLM